MLQELFQKYSQIDFADLGLNQLQELRTSLQSIGKKEIQSKEDAKKFVETLAKFREALAASDKLKGDNYPELLKSLLSVGEDGLYSNNLRFVFELIQNVDDCDYSDPSDCSLDMKFDFNNDQIILTYNETGFTPYNVFSITGIAEAAKNISNKEEIGEKGIGFKSVFGVANRVLIQSGWFSFSLYKDNFTIPRYEPGSNSFRQGTRMTLYVPHKAKSIYEQLRRQYCRKEALFSSNPILFLNKLTHLKLYYDSFRSMEFSVARVAKNGTDSMIKESNVSLSVKFGRDSHIVEGDNDQEIKCVRFSKYFTYDEESCKSRYGEKSQVGAGSGKKMLLQVVFPYPEYCQNVGNGALYSFLPTKIAFTVPIVCHVPFKLDASREFVDPQDHNRWFRRSCEYMQILLDMAYNSWKTEVKEDIIRYIPARYKSLIALNNGKEGCLRTVSCFESKHYADMSLLHTVDGTYHRISEVFSFYPMLFKTEPSIIAKLLGKNQALFLTPNGINPTSYGIQTVDDPLKDLFCKAMENSGVTEHALNILSTESYSFTDKDLLQYSNKMLTAVQIEAMMRLNPLEKLLKSCSVKKVRIGQKCLFFADERIKAQSLEQVLFKGFDVNEAPRDVARYLISINSTCACLDIPENAYLPCTNLLVLSKENPYASFSSFCYDVEPKSNFAVRLRMKEASKQLDLAVKKNIGTDQDFLTLLRDNRRFVKDALGDNGYHSYIELINRSGIDRNRFLQELLQNADDCLYPEGVIPSFKLEINNESIIVTYNECGFTRANIRAITAIGESTKNNLLAGNVNTIGEKGIGFKSVFHIASAVTISSGDFCFCLTSKEPTIPKPIPMSESIAGTRMEITLKSRGSISSYQEKDIISLCLCLRKLKKLEIIRHSVTIDDNEDQRTIIVNGRSRIFRKYHHIFSVTDKEAILERQAGIYKVQSRQDIFCYVPTRTMELDYCVYSGLPTKHKLNVPIAIDAPFMLTTSREQIDLDSKSWNGYVLREMYKAIIKIMYASRAIDRIGVLRFARYIKRGLKNNESFINNLSDSEYINSVSFADNIRTEMILPTYDTNVYSSADSMVFRFPKAVTKLLSHKEVAMKCALDLSVVIDERSDAITSKEQREHLESVLKALRVKDAPFQTFMPFLAEYAELYIDDDDYRESLYSTLEEAPQEYTSLLLEWPIVPVYDEYGGTRYISWAEDSIYVKPGAHKKAVDYEILNEIVLPKSRCEKILGVNINEMNLALEKQKYNDRLGILIHGNNMEEIYEYLIHEFNAGNLKHNGSFGLLLENRELIPLKNGLGEIVDTELFLCDQPEDYFPVTLIQKKIVHMECREFAKELRCEQMCNIHYEDFDYDSPLTEDDIECLQDTYFLHSEEILRGFYRNEYISDELIKEYGLGFLALSGFEDDMSSFSFPEEPVGNRIQLRDHIAKLLQKQIRIESVQEHRWVKKGVLPNGEYFDLRNEDAREGAIKRYSPDGTGRQCFCQICKKLKPSEFIEVNNIEMEPKRYFPELRLALCLECSKIYEARRYSAQYRSKFLENILKTGIEDQTIIAVSMGEMQISFTGKHLAEIQEILKQAKIG